MTGTLKIDLRLDVSGPLADGRAEKLVDDWLVKTTQALADEGTEMLRAFPMNKTGRARGGFQENLKTARRSPSQVNVIGPNISGVAWAPWLEGTSKRNTSTHFKGYHLFRKTRLALQKRAPEIGQKVLDELLPQMGGE